MRIGRRLFAVVLGSSAALISACGPEWTNTAPPPADPTNAAGAARPAEACRRTEYISDPLVVDWKPEQRAELDAVMREGVAVVHYDCDKVRLLKECKLEGTYGFVGTAPKEQVVQLKTDEELRANLPFSGTSLAAQLGAELKNGASLDIALTTVGKRSTSRSSANRRELKGSCDGATHFVRRTTIGAFAAQTGAQAKPPTAAQVFSRGPAGADAKGLSTIEGDLRACAGARPDLPGAPPGCGSAFRLELTAIDASVPSSAELQAPKCPKGMVRAQGKCTMAAPYMDYDCNFDDTPTCAQECKKGNVVSCGRLGWSYANGYSVGKDEPRGFELLTQACSGNSDEACAALGTMYARGGPAVAADPERARQLFERSCLTGVGRGCHNLGVVYREGVGVPKDHDRAIVHFVRSCDTGFAAGCAAAAELVVSKDKARGISLYKRACVGDHVEGCKALERLGAK